MKKRIISIILATLLVVSLLPVTAVATDFAGWTALTSDGGELTAGNYYLNEDVTLTSNITISGGEVKLDLNGHVLKGNGSGSVITINNGASLTLQDSAPTASHTGYIDASGLWHWDKDGSHQLEINETGKTINGGIITGGNYSKGGGVYNDGTFTMNGGTIAGCTATGTDTASGGGGVYNYGTFTMNGGTIVGCIVKSRGGGIYNNKTFIMNAGSIQECKAFSDSDNPKGIGGGVWNQISFTLSGGSIQNNEVSHHGGGIGNAGGGSITINSGSINNNIAAGLGGGINSDGNVTISGGTIANNTAGSDGGGVRINGDGKTLKIIGGTISNNTANRNGGGVYYGNGTVMLGGDTQITGNKAGAAGNKSENNLYLPSGKQITISDENAPTEEMEVGITLANGYSGSLINEGFSSEFFDQLTSDDPTIAFELEDSNIKKSTKSAWALLQDALNGTAISTNSAVEITNGAVRLKADIKGSTTLVIPESKTVKLDLNGHVIYKTGDGSVIVVKNNATLNLYDCGETEHTGYVDSSGLWHWDAAGTYVCQDGEIAKNIIGGVITGGNSNDGAGVLIEAGGTFNMFSGTIAGNKANNCGGGVNVRGTFNMEGGTIEYNRANPNNDCFGGGGVAIYQNGKGTLSGGIIQFNSSTVNGGGVLFLQAGSGLQNVTLAGVSIINNTAAISGGGVCFDHGNDTIILGGNTVIKDNQLGDGTKNNFHFARGTNLQLAEGANSPNQMYVGITTKEAPTESSPKTFISSAEATDIDYFFADQSTNYVDFDTNQLMLKLIPLSTISFDPNGGTCASESAITSDEGKLAVLPEARRDGYTFNGWYTETTGGVEITTSTVFITNASIYAQWSAIPAPPTPSYSGSSTVSIPANHGDDSVKLKATVSGGNATLKEITDKDLEKLLDGENSDTVVLDFSGLSKSVKSVTIPKKSLEKIEAATQKEGGKVEGLSINIPNGTILLSGDTLTELLKQAEGNTIKFAIESIKESKLTKDQKAAIKKFDKATLFDIYIESNGKRLCTKDLGGFGEEAALMLLPYEMQKGQNEHNCKVFYIAEDGSLENISALYSDYDREFILELEHLSVYAVLYSENAAETCAKDSDCPLHAYSDTNMNAWYHDGVHYCIANGIMKGVGGDLFKPTATITRAEVVTMLWRLAGEPYANYYMQFNDVAEEEWYTEAVRFAAAEKIVEGYGDGSFKPSKVMTREELATVLCRYAKYTGKDIAKATENVNTLSYNDIFDVSEWAREGMHYCIAVDVIQGNENECVMPHNKTTRAEAATMIYRFCEKVLNK